MSGWADSLDRWLLLGLVGQAIFSARFLTQWLASERAGKSVIPTSFWWMSLFGSVILFIYGLQRKEPVLVIGQCTGLWIYGRNLVLLRREFRLKARLDAAAGPHSRPRARLESATESADCP